MPQFGLAAAAWLPQTLVECAWSSEKHSNGLGLLRQQGLNLLFDLGEVS
jgi:hypothetical protein